MSWEDPLTGQAGVFLGSKWLAYFYSLSSPLEGCRVVWGWGLGGVGNLSRDSPLLGRVCSEGPPVFLL